MFMSFRLNNMFMSFRSSMTAATSKIERFAIIVDGWKMERFTIITTKRSILGVAAVLDPPL